MASVPSSFSLKKEDFPDGLSSKEDFDRFASQFNTFIRQTVALGGAVNVQQNVDGLVASYPVNSTVFPQRMVIAPGRKPIGLLLLGCVDNSQTGATPAFQPTLAWTYAPPAPGQPNMLAYTIGGLVVGRKYTATLHVLYANPGQ